VWLAAGLEPNMFALADDVLNGVALRTANNVLALRQSNCEFLQQSFQLHIESLVNQAISCYIRVAGTVATAYHQLTMYHCCEGGWSRPYSLLGS
jgi:hypothetical protein